MSELRTVDRALSLLEVVASVGDREWSLAELSSRSSLPKATTLRMLGALQKRQLILREKASGRYRLSPHVLSLTASFQPRLRALARPALQNLVNLTGETALLSLIDGTMRVCADEVVSPDPVRLSYGVGYRAALHAGASGKVLLAFLPEEERKSLLDQLSLDPYTPATPTSREALERDLEGIRKIGFAVSLREFDYEVFGISAPVHSAGGRLEGALVVAGPMSRWRPERCEAYVSAVLGVAKQLSFNLGYAQVQTV